MKYFIYKTLNELSHFLIIKTFMYLKKLNHHTKHAVSFDNCIFQSHESYSNNLIWGEIIYFKFYTALLASIWALSWFKKNFFKWFIHMFVYVCDCNQPKMAHQSKFY